MSEQESKEHACEAKLLSDAPVTEDAFGPHRTVAHAIADLIRNEEGGKAVGLQGAWGSGKSTVVRILEGLLESQGSSLRDTTVFVFDAWEHQNDPLRRSFLEKIIAFLNKQHWLNTKDWEDDLERIKHRKETTRTTTKPFLSPAGNLLGLSALLLPIGYVLLQVLLATLLDEQANYSLRQLWPYFLVAVALVLGPGLVAAGVWLYWRPTHDIRKRDFWVKNRKPHDKESVLALFVNKSVEVQESDTIRTRDPTSIEFREILGRVLSETLDPKNRRLVRCLVIVVDNLDRVSAEETVVMLGTMVTLLGMADRPRPVWLSHLWLVVPYAHSSLAAVWKDNPSFAKPFLEKSFQVVFQIPEPLMSKWKGYFHDQFAQAFPKHDSEDARYAVWRLYNLHRLRRVVKNDKRKDGEETGAPTPREIKIFLNDLVSLFLQRGETIPLAMQALYLVCRGKIGDNPSILCESDWLDPRVLSLVGQEDWQKYLAALHFNVEPDGAMELLIRPDIEKALAEGSADALGKHMGTTGSWGVCADVIHENYLGWAENEPRSLALAAIALDGVECSEPPTASHIWRRLADTLARTQAIEEVDGQLGNGFAAIIRHAQDERLRPTIESALGVISRVPVQDGDSDEEKAMRQRASSPWAHAALAVVQAALERGLEPSVFDEHLRVPGPPDFYLDVVRAICAKQPEHEALKYFRPSADAKSVVAELVNVCNNGNLENQTVDLIQSMARVDEEWPWQDLHKVINNRLNNPGINHKEVHACVKTLLYFAHELGIEQCNTWLDQLCKEGFLFHHLQKSTDGNPETSALLMLPILEFIPEGNASGNQPNTQQGKQFYDQVLDKPVDHEEVVKEFTAAALRFGRLRPILEAEMPGNVYQFLGHVIASAIEYKEAIPGQIDSAFVWGNYLYVREVVPDDQTMQRLVGRLVKENGLLDILRQSEFDADKSELYLLAYESSTDSADQGYIHFLIEALRGVARECWNEQLKDEGPLVRLAIALLSKGESLQLGVAYEDALKDHARELLEGKIKFPKDAQVWKVLPKGIEANLQEAFLLGLFRTLQTQNKKGLSGWLLLYGDMLLAWAEFPKQSDSVISLLWGPIVDRAEPEEVAWLQDCMRRFPNLLEKCNKSLLSEFKGRIEDALQRNNLSEDQEQVLRAIADSAGVKVPKPAPEEEEEKQGPAEDEVEEADETE